MKRWSIITASYRERKDVALNGGQLAMKPTSEQTRNGVLTAVTFPPEEVLNMKSFFRQTIERTEVAAGTLAAVVDPSSAYGCVDWYIYPDSKPKNAAA
jgi:hypothetical protein